MAIASFARQVSAALAVVCAGLLGVSVALHAANVGRPAAAEGKWWLMQAAMVVAFGFAGVLLAACRPSNVVGWLLAGVGVVQAVAFAAVEFGVYLLDGSGSVPNPLMTFVLWVAGWLWVAPLLVVGCVLPLLLPDGRLPSPRWRPALLLSGACIVACSVLWALTPYGFAAPALVAAGAHNPFGVGWGGRPGGRWTSRLGSSRWGRWSWR